MHFTIRPLLLIGILLLPFSSHAHDAKPGESHHAYTMGIVPQFDARRTYKIWRPILDELEKRTGLHFTIRGSATIPAFELEFNAGAFDFAYINPYHVLLSSKGEGYIPLVRDTGRALQGIIVVQKDSPIQSVKELAGKTVAFPAPNSTGATLLTRSELLDQYQVKVVPRFVKTHSSVYLNVALGQAVAGGAVQKTLSQQKAEIKNALRVLYRTQGIAPHPFTAHPRVPKEVRKKVKAALLEMGQDENSKQLLSRVPIKTIGVATIKDYQPLANMGLERFK